MTNWMLNMHEKFVIAYSLGSNNTIYEALHEIETVNEYRNGLMMNMQMG